MDIFFIFAVISLPQVVLAFHGHDWSFSTDVSNSTKPEVSWGDWSEWSVCSRTCGGGVAIQTRRCLDVNGCKGSSVKYRMCNEQPCPEGSIDFRYEQCADFNSITYDEEIHQWEPASSIDGNQCALTCRARAKNGPPVMLKARVIDGTPCTEDITKVCVHGECQSVGCDGVPGSNIKLDSCGVCGGDGSSCDENHTQWVEAGYGPCSATCGGGYKTSVVVCQETMTGRVVTDDFCTHSEKPSKRVSPCAAKSCPASWEVGPWESCSVSCGTGYQLREVSCNELRNRSHIRVADHECSVPRPQHRRSCGDQKCPKWYGGIWSECSVTCGEGVQRRVVQCRDRYGMTSELCKSSNRPESTKPCRTGVKCPPPIQAHPNTISISAWAEDEPPNNELLLEASETYLNEATVPSEPTFIHGKWSQCSTTCGEGIQTRSVKCKIFLEFSRTVADLPDNQCPGTKPFEVRRCYLKTCPSLMLSESAFDKNEIARNFASHESLEPISSSLLFHMNAKEEEKHSLQENPHLQSLEEDTIPNDGQSLDLKIFPVGKDYEDPTIVSLDLDKLKTHRKQRKNSGDHDGEYEIYGTNSVEFKWIPDGFTPCSASCLGGVQESMYQCVRKSDELEVSAILCDPSSRPDIITKTCNDFPCPPQWESSEFGQCSLECGGGVKKREVKCVHQVTASLSTKSTLPDSLCPQPPPTIYQYCNMNDCPPSWTTGKWSKCSVNCGRGVKTRTVECVIMSSDRGKVQQPAFKCPKSRPQSVRKCKDFKCKKRNRSRHSKKYPRLIKIQKNQDFHQKKFMKTVILKVGGHATVFHGSNLKVKCPTKSQFRSSITWWRNGKKLGFNGATYRKLRVTRKGVLKIHRVQYADAAVYVCRVKEQSASLTLKVEPLPSSFALFEPNAVTTLRKAKEKVEDRSNISSNNLEFTTVRPNFDSKGSNSGFLAKPNKKEETIEEIRETTTKNDVKIDYKTSDSEESNFVYGEVSHQGHPAKLSSPTRGISLLSREVALSKKAESSNVQESSEPGFGVQESGVLGSIVQRPTAKVPSVFPSEEMTHSSPLKQPIYPRDKYFDEFPFGGTYGKILTTSNRTQSRSDREEEFFFGTVKHSAKVNDPLRIPNFLGSETKVSMGVPQILGKGNRDSLGFEWRVSNWTDCSQTCSFSGSTGGYQIRTTECLVRVENVSQVVDGALCEDAGLASPLTIQRCGYEECPHWEANTWTDCDKSRCFTHHYAYQRRNVACKLYNNTEVSPSYCDDVTRPNNKRECYNRQCRGVWRTGEWSQCTGPCNGQGYRTRLLHCVWNGTRKSAGIACRNLPRPDVVKWCNGPPCPPKKQNTKPVDENCTDMSRYCKIVKRINMCRVHHYKTKCCRSCQ